jgi:hypothetical protein
VPAVVGESAWVGAGQAEPHEHSEDRQFDSDDEDLRPSDELGADQVHHHHRYDGPDTDRLARPTPVCATEVSPADSRRIRAAQGHRDDPAEELKSVEPTGDNAVTEISDQELRLPPRLGYFALSSAYE